MHATRRRRWLPTPKIWQLAAAVLAVGLALAAVQKTAGFFFQSEIEIGTRSQKQIRPRFGSRANHFAAQVPEKYRSDLVVARGILLEDGLPLPHRKISVSSIDGSILGAYTVTLKYVHFQPSDGGDPNQNGKKYTLRIPQRVKPGLLWGLFGGLVLATHLGFRPDPGGRSLLGPPRWCRPPARPRPWLEGTAVLIVSMAAGGFALVRFHELCDGGLCVLGKPYSDAIGWHQVAVFLREGLGFTAAYSDNRPFYPIFQAMVFLFTGDSVVAAQGTNVFLLGMGGFFVYAATRELFPRPVAVAVLAFVLLAESHQRMAPMLLTELPAYAFGAAGLFLLARGCSPDPRNRRSWLLFLAGLFLGCSNLARPHTLFALPLAALVILHAGVAGRWGWRPVVLRVGVLGSGIVLVFLPWVLREKRVHDVWGISLNSSEMLYATASTHGGKWNAEEFAEAAKDGYSQDDPAALHHYFGRRLAATVKADPAAYAATLGRGFVDFFRALTIEKPAILGVLAVLVLGVLGAGACRLRSALPLFAAPAFWMLGAWADGWRGYELVPGALLVVLVLGEKRARGAALIVALFLGGTGLLSSMVGNFGMRRGEPIIEWLFVMTVCAAAYFLARGWCRGAAWFAGRPAAFPLPISPALLPGPVGFVHLLGGFMVLAGAVLVARGFGVGGDAPGRARIGKSARDTALAATRAHFPEMVGIQDSLLFAAVVTPNDYDWKIPAGNDVGHWSRLFERRREARVAAYLTVGTGPAPGAGFVAAQFPGTLDKGVRNHPQILVGIRNFDPHPPMDHDPLVIEALALIPLGEESGEPDLGRALYFPPSSEVKRLLGGVHPSAGTGRPALH